MITMRKTRHLTPAVTAAFILMVVGILTTLGTYVTLAAESAATDCLVALQAADKTALPADLLCKDGAACDSDGKTDGSCAIKVRAVANKPATGCTPQPIKSIKVTPKKLGITVPVPTASASAEGAFVDVVLALKGKNHDKPSKKKKIKALAKAVAKKTKDIDKSKIQCVKCDQASCVPTTTTTTTTTNTPPTTAPVPICGNGAIDAGETCDFSAAPNGCPGGQFCNSTDCSGCNTTCSQLVFKLGAPTLDCGFPGADIAGAAPFSGELQDANGKVADLGLGCLYIGGGQATIVPPGPTPNGSSTILGVTDCSVNALALTGTDTHNLRNCTVGPKATKHCANGHPGTDGQHACASDADCQNPCVNESNTPCTGDPQICHCVDGAPGLPNKDAGTCSSQAGCVDSNGMCGGGACGTCSGDAGTACGCNFDCNGRCKQNSNCGASYSSGTASLVCLEDPTCIFGNPLPIDNGTLSTCVLNVIKDGVTGSADVAAGTASVTVPLKSWVHLTGLDADHFAQGNPCPICDNGVCNAGSRAGLPCSTNSTLKTTHDCPPPGYLFLAPLDVTLGPLTSSVVNENDPTGIFCPPNQATAGAFGVTEATVIIENGTPAAGGLDGTFKDATLASVFCIPATNSLLIDQSANLPGPGAIGLGGQVRLQ